MTDLELLDATRRGDREAFGLLVQRYQRMVEAAAFSATGRDDLVDDIVQDTFINAWCTIERLRDADSLRSWLYGIARNLGHKARRKHGRVDPLDNVPPLEVDGPSALDALVERERDREIAAAVKRLPARYREPLVLFYYEHCTVKEVAATLAMHEDAAMQRLSRGRRKLGEQLATRVETVLESKRSRAALAAGLLLLLPARASAAPLAVTAPKTATTVATNLAPIRAWLVAHARLVAAVLGTAAALTVFVKAIERSNAVAAHAAARAPAQQPTQKPALPPPWTSLKPRVADPEHVYRSISVAPLDPVEACARGARSVVMSALGAGSMVERDGKQYFEPSGELVRIRDEAGARTGITCGGDKWPEIYVLCEGTLADIRDGTINCYPHDPFVTTTQ